MSESRSGQIRFLVENYYDLQKLRVEAFNRVVAYVKSHGFSENHQSNASHVKLGTQDIDASQPAFETRKRNASHYPCETHIISASVKPSVFAHKIVKGKVEVPHEISEVVWYHNRLYTTEKELAKRLDTWSSTHPLRINFLSKIQGIGPILSSALIAWLAPISRFSNISKLWAYSGMSPFHYQCQCEKKHKFLVTSPPHCMECPVKVGTKRQSCKAKIVECVKVNKPIRHKRGYLAFFNPHVKTLLWKVASSFEKQKAEKSFYRCIYQTKKAEYLQRVDLKKAIDDKVKGAKLHVRLMSMKYTSKRFLADMWLFWRKLEGLPITKPYAHTVLGHTNYQPWEPDKL